jgi:hypothetical protein
MSNAGLHVSDYTDKEKSRNNIQNANNAQNELFIDRNSKKEGVAQRSQVLSKMTTNQST